jgi:hypothetical protein
MLQGRERENREVGQGLDFVMYIVIMVESCANIQEEGSLEDFSNSSSSTMQLCALE